MPQLSLPNAQIPDLYKGRNELYKSLGQLLGMAGAKGIAGPAKQAEEENLRSSLNKLLNPDIPETRKEPVAAGQYTKEQAKSPDVLRKALNMEKPSIAEIEGREGPGMTTLPAFKEYVPKGTSRKTMESIQEEMIKSKVNPSGMQRGPSKMIQGFGPDGKAWWYKPDSNSPTGYSPVMPIAPMPQVFKERVKGDVGPNPEEDFQVETFDTSGKAGVTVRKKEVPGRVVPPIKSTPDAEIQKGVMYDTLKGNIGRIKQSFDPEWVGPAAGRFYATKEALAGLDNPAQVGFYADTRDLADMLLRARSGAQINEQEYQRLSKLVPTPNLPPDVYLARLNRFEEQLNGMMTSQKSRLGAGGYLAGPNTQTQQPSPNKTVVKTGRDRTTGRNVVMYSDGSVEYAE